MYPYHGPLFRNLISSWSYAFNYTRFNKTPVIMASGRELCYVLLSGFICCYGMTFIMVAKPTVVTCTSLRLGLGLSLSICYAALFTKTNRISRIFNRGVKAMVKRPSYTSPKSQLMIVGLLVAVQCMGALTWIGMDLPGTTYLYPDRETVVLRCKSTNFAVVMSLLYNMILIILCTVYAFKTRKIPENYNEAKYIAFTMYSTCIVWLAFIPIYFGTKNDFKVRFRLCIEKLHSLLFIEVKMCIHETKNGIDGPSLHGQSILRNLTIYLGTGSQYKISLFW